MTTKLTVLAWILSLTVASTAFAQRASTASGQKAVTAPALPAAPALPPVPYFDLHQIDLPHVAWQSVDFPHVEIPHIEIPEVHIDFDAIRESVASAQQMAEVGAGQAVNFNFQENFQFQERGQIDSQYSQARSRIDNNQYDRALEPLDRVISAKGERADAAMYWKAYSLMKLARRDEALSTLGQLTKQFPNSPWVKDARALEVEVKQAAGQNVSTDTTDDELKLLALQGIMRSDADAALPAVEKLLAGSGSVRLKERALFVLSQSRNDRAVGIIGNVARTNSNPDLQQRAIRILGTSNNTEAINTLVAVYKADNSVETKKTVISALASSSRNTAAVTALIALARAERNVELKTSIVRYLSNSNSPEAKAYLLELIK
jgi:tetratricopeptide (TPR) repeat protein